MKLTIQPLNQLKEGQSRILKRDKERITEMKKKIDNVSMGIYI